MIAEANLQGIRERYLEGTPHHDDLRDLLALVDALRAPQEPMKPIAWIVNLTTAFGQEVNGILTPEPLDPKLVPYITKKEPLYRLHASTVRSLLHYVLVDKHCKVAAGQWNDQGIAEDVRREHDLAFPDLAPFSLLRLALLDDYAREPA